MDRRAPCKLHLHRQNRFRNAEGISNECLKSNLVRILQTQKRNLENICTKNENDQYVANYLVVEEVVEMYCCCLKTDRQTVNHYRTAPLPPKKHVGGFRFYDIKKWSPLSLSIQHFLRYITNFILPRQNSLFKKGSKEASVKDRYLTCFSPRIARNTGS